MAWTLCVSGGEDIHAFQYTSPPGFQTEHVSSRKLLKLISISVTSFYYYDIQFYKSIFDDVKNYIWKRMWLARSYDQCDQPSDSPDRPWLETLQQPQDVQTINHKINKTKNKRLIHFQGIWSDITWKNFWSLFISLKRNVCFPICFWLMYLVLLS